MNTLKYLIYLAVGGLASAQSSDQALFQLVPAAESGVDYLHVFDENHERSYLNYSGSIIGGMCVGDVDGDGLNDIYLSGAAGENALFRNLGEFKFSAKKLPTTLQGDKSWGTGAALVDIDNDGDLDLYQCNFGIPNQLFMNDGKGNFTELAGAAGLGVTDASNMASFADVDGDGDLDMFLLCNEYFRANGRPADFPIYKVNGESKVKPEFEKSFNIIEEEDGTKTLSEYGRRDYLFINQGKDENGELRFEDVSEKSGVSLKGFGLSAVWWDYDSDGDQDLYVANDFDMPDRLFRNDGVNNEGIPLFTDVIDKVFPSISWSAMGSDAADINNDGLPDLFSVEMSATTHYKSKTSMGELTTSMRKIYANSKPKQYMRNHLQVNTGMGYFQETAFASGIASTDWSWAAKFGDLDQDGYQDIFVSNGIARDVTNADFQITGGSLDRARIGRTLWDIYKDTPPRPEKNIVYRNLDGKKFEKRQDWGLDLMGMSYSTAMVDLDNDGDLDIIVSDLGKQTKIYRNNKPVGNAIRVALEGTKSNKMGVGARVIVTDEKGVRRTRWLNPWTGFQSQNDLVLHFGLGESKAEKLEVFWPSGLYQNVKLGDKSFIRVVEKEAGKLPEVAKVKLRFKTSEAPEFLHQDEIYDDFVNQPLLPQKLSQLGPCLAKGDIDGDGDEDFFVGGAKGQAGALFISDNGKFIDGQQSAFSEIFDESSEDTASMMFDADGDGDLDLLVISGSVEYEAGDMIYNDRLYINTLKDGKAELVLAMDGEFPALTDSGSCVVAGDMDNDGDLDIFIGARSVVDKYPSIPQSRLIRNDSKDGKAKFTDITEGNLKLKNMVTDATWADLDGDDFPELVVATDWGPVKIFHNNKGKLEDVSAEAGTQNLSGWWRSIKAVDVDGDGDLDLVAGNSGINTKYKSPSAKYPAVLYYGDLDGSGKTNIVEAKMDKEKDRPLPVRGRF